MDKQEGSLSGRCCAPWRQASALHKIGGRASAPPLAHQIFISPRSYFATTTRARTIVWNIDRPILFLTFHSPLPRAWPCLRRSFPLLLLLPPDVESLSLYVPPFKPAISLTVPAMSTVDHGESSIENACISGATPLESTASSLLPLHILCKTPFLAAGPSFACLNGCCVSLLARSTNRRLCKQSPLPC